MRNTNNTKLLCKHGCCGGSRKHTHRKKKIERKGNENRKRTGGPEKNLSRILQWVKEIRAYLYGDQGEVSENLPHLIEQFREDLEEGGVL